MEEGTRAFEEIHEILYLANFALDTNLLRRKILELLFGKLYVESSVFYLPDEKSKSTGGIEVNLQEKYVRQYKEYFHQYDPIQRIKASQGMRRVIRLEELIDYRSFVSSAFYCDFLRPQNIHHKLYINLYTGDRYHGRIALYRPAKSRKFSEENVRVLRRMAPFFSFALDHNDLLMRTKIQEGALKLLDKNMSIGIILVDDSIRPMYMNQKAKAFCQDLFGRAPHEESLLDDCRALSEELKKSRADGFVPPRYRVLRINRLKRLHLSSRVLERGTTKNGRLFMISIEEVRESGGFDPDRLKETYNLTNREIDIVLHTYQGLKNAEIARRLFISEITVKKHIQNIFQKTGVKSRTALVHKILEDCRISFSGPGRVHDMG